jgi:hypothetical protein
MFYDGHVHIEEEDQCYSCEYFLKGVMCPLLEALAVGVAHLDGDVYVKNCGFYVKFERHLHVIDGSPTDTDDADTKPDRKRPDRTKRFN